MLTLGVLSYFIQKSGDFIFFHINKLSYDILVAKLEVIALLNAYTEVNLCIASIGSTLYFLKSHWSCLFIAATVSVTLVTIYWPTFY